MVTKIELRSLIYVPEGSGPHPVLCFLHGAGEAAAGLDGKLQSLAEILRHRSPAWHAENGSAFGSRFLVVCPQLERRRRWETADAPSVDAAVRVAIEEYHGDSSRLMLTGFSYGGEGAFLVASASKLAWPAIWAVDPAFRQVPPLPAADVRVWVHYGSEPPDREKLERFLKDNVFREWSGDKDARRVKKDLRQSHTATCAAAYADTDVYKWLFPDVYK